jgi:hypothetical protein
VAAALVVPHLVQHLWRTTSLSKAEVRKRSPFSSTTHTHRHTPFGIVHLGKLIVVVDEEEEEEEEDVETDVTEDDDAEEPKGGERETFKKPAAVSPVVQLPAVAPVADDAPAVEEEDAVNAPDLPGSLAMDDDNDEEEEEEEEPPPQPTSDMEVDPTLHQDAGEKTKAALKRELDEGGVPSTDGSGSIDPNNMETPPPPEQSSQASKESAGQDALGPPSAKKPDLEVSPASGQAVAATAASPAAKPATAAPAAEEEVVVVVVESTKPKVAEEVGQEEEDEAGRGEEEYEPAPPAYDNLPSTQPRE